MNQILPRFKYPKFLLLLLTFVAAYFIFEERNFLPFHNLLLSLGYFGTFLTGIFFVYGFTAAPATAILLILGKDQNILISGLIAGLGALVGDLIIFKFVKHYFSDEIKRLAEEKPLVYAQSIIPNPIKRYFIILFAGFIIASPLPDEVGISLLAGATNISIKMFSFFSYVINTIGIFIILIIGSSI